MEAYVSFKGGGRVRALPSKKSCQMAAAAAQAKLEQKHQPGNE
jgi:hypothetical protein